MYYSSQTVGIHQTLLINVSTKWNMINVNFEENGTCETHIKIKKL